MPELFDVLIPAHWVRPWALWGLLGAVLLAYWGRRIHQKSDYRGVIAPHLLPHLIVRAGKAHKLHPSDTLSIALVCFSLGLAGPAWKRVPPLLAKDEAPLMVAVDLSLTADAVDLLPSRLAVMQHKLHQLIELQGESPIGLLVYAGSAHLVLPPTSDRNVLKTYLDSLSTSLMPKAGQSPSKALSLAMEWLDRSPIPGTMLILTANWPAQEMRATEVLVKRSPHRLLVWGIGTIEGGIVRNSQGQYIADDHGKILHTRLEVNALKHLREITGAGLVSITTDDSDLQRVQSLIKQHHNDLAEHSTVQQWDDRGHVLIWPGLLALMISFRRGWVVPWQFGSHWLGILLVILLTQTGPTWADAMEKDDWSGWQRWIVSLWLTPDQQGRWWLERAQPERAARLFKEPMWQGASWARAGQWQAAADAFARVDSAAAWFNHAQMLARLGRYPEAIDAYDKALVRSPGWPEALADRESILNLHLAIQKANADEVEPVVSHPGDQREGSPRERKRPPSQQFTEEESSELWLQRLDTSPADFLKRKFLIQLEQAESMSRATP